MNKNKRTPAFLRAPKTVASVLISCGLISQGVLADTSREESLESRVLELEQRLTELTEQQSSSESKLEEVEVKMSSAESASEFAVKVGGYVKLDVISINAAKGDQDGHVLDSFYVPGLTPVGTSDDGSEWDTHLTAQESRFWVGANKTFDNGDKLGGKIELDFYSLADTGGNERVSNSYSPRLRQAYLTYNNFLAGQTWSTFMHLHALPEGVDFAPLADARVFVRQAMVRWSPGAGISLALENPSTTITPYEGGDRIVADDGAIPDVVVKWAPSVSWGSFSIAGIARQLSYNDKENDTEATAYGVSLGSKIQFGEDDLRLGLVWGDGMGRYLGLNSGNDAVLDASGELETIEQMGIRLAYRHFWSPKWRSTIGYSVLETDNPTSLTGTGVTSETRSALANVMYTVLPKFTVMAEYMYAEREIESGDSGDQSRIHFAAKYAF